MGKQHFALTLIVVLAMNYTYADSSRVLNADSLLCVGQAEADPTSKISLKIRSTLENGLSGHTIEYTRGTASPVALKVSRPLMLSYEGSYYIQTVESGFNLAIGNDDIRMLSKDTDPNINSSSMKSAYRLSGNVSVNGTDFDITCIGNFSK